MCGPRPFCQWDIAERHPLLVVEVWLSSCLLLCDLDTFPGILELLTIEVIHAHGVLACFARARNIQVSALGIVRSAGIDFGSQSCNREPYKNKKHTILTEKLLNYFLI